MKYLLISLGVILLIIFGIVIFNSSGSKTVKAPTTNKTIKLVDYASNNNSSVQYIVDGSIVARENHRTVEITIGPTTRNITVLGGYQNQVIGSQTLPNDPAAFRAFLAALNRSGFTKERKLSTPVDTESICPSGSRNYYKLVENNKNLMNLWTASCIKGSFDGSKAIVASLFHNQFPNYDNSLTVANAGSGGNLSF